MIFLLAGLAFIVTGYVLGYVLTTRPWWSFLRLRELAGVAVVLACGTRYHRRMLAVVLKARAEAATPPYRLPVLLPEKTLVAGYITDRDYNRGTSQPPVHSRERLARAARVTGAAPVRGHAGPREAVHLGFVSRDEARARVMSFDDIFCGPGGYDDL